MSAAVTPEKTIKNRLVNFGRVHFEGKSPKSPVRQSVKDLLRLLASGVWEGENLGKTKQNIDSIRSKAEDAMRQIEVQERESQTPLYNLVLKYILFVTSLISSELTIDLPNIVSDSLNSIKEARKQIFIATIFAKTHVMPSQTNIDKQEEVVQALLAEIGLSMFKVNIKTPAKPLATMKQILEAFVSQLQASKRGLTNNAHVSGINSIIKALLTGGKHLNMTETTKIKSLFEDANTGIINAYKEKISGLTGLIKYIARNETALARATKKGGKSSKRKTLRKY